MRADELYAAAKDALEKNESLVPVGDDQDLGCAISLTVLLGHIGVIIEQTQSTATLLKEMTGDPQFQEITEAEAGPGDIIISATGTSLNPKTPIAHGHCGVIGRFGIMANNSFNGLWSEDYTWVNWKRRYELEDWKRRYELEGGYPTRYFRIQN